MSSILFQEMRESRALAYAVFSSYSQPSKKGEPNYLIAYIGTQADKLPETLSGMFELLNNIPRSEKKIEAGKNAVIQKINTERITKSNILFEYIPCSFWEKRKNLIWKLYNNMEKLNS